MNISFKHLIIISPLLIATLFTGCASGTSTPSASDVRSYADPAAENILVSLDKNDYTGFSKDFGPAAQSALTATTFPTIHNQIKSVAGDYESKVFLSSQAQGDAVTASYVGHFSTEPAGVIVTVSFQTVNGTRKVSGLNFDSPRLRGQTIDVKAVRAYTDAATVNILESIKNNDYAAFSRDFNQAMKNAIPASGFENLRVMIETKVGDYISSEFETLAFQNNINVLRYYAQYDDEPAGVWVTISFDSSNKVAGLFFNSPKINAK
jgi:hypothetical protein